MLLDMLQEAKKEPGHVLPAPVEDAQARCLSMPLERVPARSLPSQTPGRQIPRIRPKPGPEGQETPPP